MRVTLLGHTALTWFDTFQMSPFEPTHPDTGWDQDAEDNRDADLLAEFAGRACYQSWNRPNPKTATNEGYLKNILDQKHESVLEHASATFYIEGVSRSLTHELIRHRHLSYSELSQRYVNVEDSPTVFPPAVLDNSDVMTQYWVENGQGYADQMNVKDAVESAHYETRDAYRHLVQALVDAGLARKQAREAARAVLPNATETKIVVTGNMRAWRDMLKKRWHVAADAEIREFAGEILRQLREIAPNSFQDIPEEPYE